MNNIEKCPVCKDTPCKVSEELLFECDICGPYTMDPLLYWQAHAGDNHAGLWELTPIQRKILSHRIRKKSGYRPMVGNDPFQVTPEVLESIRSDGRLPSPAEQAANLIRLIGDEISQSGEIIDPLHIDAVLQTFIGSSSKALAKQLIEELGRKNIVMVSTHTSNSDGTAVFYAINLTLDGWERYEAEKRGKFKGNYGFIAMQFGDVELDSFVQDVIKPTVKKDIGYELVDMRDVSEAGIIDNIMRVRIRGAAFVIADLTHDNRGAYWEAGYAEGLGKPVIYICEKKKFEKKKTHFDTNHCTTVPWSRNDDEGFRRKLIATIRRSIDLSP